MVKKPYISKKCSGQTGSGPPCKNYDPEGTRKDGGPPDPCTTCKWYFPSLYEPEPVEESSASGNLAELVVLRQVNENGKEQRQKNA